VYTARLGGYRLFVLLNDDSRPYQQQRPFTALMHASSLPVAPAGRGADQPGGGPTHHHAPDAPRMTRGLPLGQEGWASCAVFYCYEFVRD
jgi:hypothetical protein